MSIMDLIPRATSGSKAHSLTGRCRAAMSGRGVNSRRGRGHGHRHGGTGRRPMLEQLEVRRLLAIATETVTVNSATLATDRSGTYFSGATTGIPGTTPPPSWQQ